MAAADWDTIIAGKIVTNNGEYIDQMVTGHLIANPSTVFQRSFRYSNGITSLQNAVRVFLDGVDKTASVSKIPVTPGTPLDLTPPAVVPPTQADLDRAAYFAAKAKVVTLTQLVALKRTGVTQVDLDAATAAWNALPFLPSYEGLI